jgi:putative tricarboxylic transport membrane protein
LAINFPKILGILSILVSSTIILGLEKNKHNNNGTEIDYRRILDYNLGPAIFLVIMMALYAITLRPLGFFISTITFLTVSGYILGERKVLILLFVAALASFIIWYLVEQVLGIYLRPFPSIF